MRIPLSWLKEYVNITQTPAEIARILTMAGLEVEDCEIFGTLSQKIVVAHVLEVNKHPQADKLQIALVSDGTTTYQIVCGAPNCRAGLKTALACVGATLKDGDSGEFTIQHTRIRGVDSYGMLCSAQELGLSSDADQILELSEDLRLGTALSDIYEDVIFDIALTPNLNHCNSVMGVARELVCHINQRLQLPDVKIQTVEEKLEKHIHVHVTDQESCPRYACRFMRNITVKASPEWLKRRLEMGGLRSINHVVDVTNYVLLEMGHPLHAFDHAKLSGDICVRCAQNNELIQTLDGKNRTLDDSMLIISDQSKPIAIAGIMGSANSTVDYTTRDIVLEAAYFEPTNIRRTSKKLGLQTDASKLFERGTDPNQLLSVLDRAAQLIQEIGGGEILNGVCDIKNSQFPQRIVTCRLSRINRLLGTILSRDEIENIFTALSFAHEWDGQDSFTLHIPTYRTDIRAEVDIIEEVARIYGYGNIAQKEQGRYHYSILPHAPIYQFEEFMRTRMVAEGLQEFVTCDLIGPSLLEIVYEPTFSKEEFIEILNPTSIEQSILRTSLLPSLLQVVKNNYNHQIHDIRGFEVGHIHFRRTEQYREQSVLGLILCGKATSYHWTQPERLYDFFDLKGIVENLLRELGVDQVTFKNLDLPTFHCGRQASVYVDSLEIGSIGEIHPAIQRRLDVPQRILFGEFNLKDLLEVIKPLKNVQALALYPASERDWTFSVHQSVPFVKILNAIPYEQCPLLEEVSLKDIYRSDTLEAGYQNITLHFIYRDPIKTVLQADVDAEHERLQHSVLRHLVPEVRI